MLPLDYKLFFHILYSTHIRDIKVLSNDLKGYMLWVRGCSRRTEGQVSAALNRFLCQGGRLCCKCMFKPMVFEISVFLTVC